MTGLVPTYINVLVEAVKVRSFASREGGLYNNRLGEIGCPTLVCFQLLPPDFYISPIPIPVSSLSLSTSTWLKISKDPSEEI